MERSALDWLFCGCPRLKVGVDADERFRPEAIRCIDRLNLGSHLHSPDLRKRARKADAVAHDRAIEVEYVH